MKFPLSWLKEYIDITLPPAQIAKILTLAGIEVESIEKAELGFDKVVVGEVLRVAKHPNADKLTVAEVTDGVDQFQVVCGAPNCREGMKSAFALIGATISASDGEQLKVKKSKIRGVESFGMLCSGAELGISDDEEGIIEFSEHLPAGADVSEIYSDTIFEVSLTPNLSHAASLIGIARELSAATGIPLRMPLVYVKEGEGFAKDAVKVMVKDAKDCPHYACRVIQGFKTAESPAWLKKRLLACGIRPIHAAVDVTNYVLMERGQPLHAFDLDTVEGSEIIVRKAHPHETIETLDGKLRELSPEMLVIADTSRPSAIAGVMGGARSEVTPDTKRVLLESAYFRRGSIRRTSKALGLVTDSSRHFERGVNPNGVIEALDRAAMLLKEWTEAEVLQGVVSEELQTFPPLEIRCRLQHVNRLLGTHLGIGEVESMLQRLGLDSTPGGEETVIVRVPTFRVDITQEVDLVEEIARMIGYDNIPRHEAVHHSSAIPDYPLFHFERNARTRLVGEGLQEFLTCDLIGPTLLSMAPDPKTPKDAFVRVVNPTSIEQSIMRTSLLQGLLDVVKFNYDHGNHNVSGFEVGRVHFKIGGQYSEPTVVGIVLTGESRPHHIDPKPHAVDFYDIKGIIENLLESLNIKRYTFRFSHIETFHSGRQALVQVDGVDIGSLGEIHPAIQKKMDIPQRIYFAELNLTDLLKSKKGDLKMRPIPEFPSSERDWTVTVKEAVPIQQIIGSIQHIPCPLLEPEDVTLVAVYRSEKIGLQVKNVTLHFVYRDKTKTVSQEEVEMWHKQIIATAEKMLGSALQSLQD
jgi:phenylalanyl-tRNA synthetase beta chain